MILKNKFYLLLALCFFLSSFTVEDRSTLKVLTPSLAERTTKKIRLENGLEALLISDPDTHQSGAALAVNVGSFNDPDDRPGMAHFIEHMLFMGTEKFPDEEEYQSFLNTHGGKCNAFTCEDRTVYSFACDNPHFEAGLDRFSSLFTAPLFRPSSLQREVRAIDQEFIKDLPLDMWRLLYVKKEQANPEHPFHRFCIGNIDTLADANSEELRSWFLSHYSSDLMHLVVYGSETMETLEKQVEAFFSKVPKRTVQKTTCDKPLFLAKAAEKILAVTPLQQLKMVEFSWELPAIFCNDKEFHADQLVAFVLGHEGENSLFASLKKDNLAENLSARTEQVGGNKAFFTMSVELTNKGIDAYDEVIDRCFDAINSYAKTEMPEYIFNELRNMRTLKYAYQSREEPFEYVTEMAYAMVDEPLETFPEKTLLPTTYHPETIQKFWDHLKKETCRLTLVVDPKLVKTKADKKEKWMGTEYTFLPLTTKKNTSEKKKVELPRKNPFLPENLKVIGQVKKDKSLELPKPKMLLENDCGAYFFAADDRFLTPEITWVFSYKTPLIIASDPKSLVLADLYCYALSKRLNAIAYETKLGGLNYSLSTKENGIHVKIDGFSEKASDCLKTLLDEMKQFRPKEEEFMAALSFYKADYKNRLNKTPISQTIDVVSNVLYKNSTSLSAKIKALAALKTKDFSDFSLALFDQGYVEGMLYGNMQDDEATTLVSTIEKIWGSKPYPKKDHFKKALATFPDDKGPLYFNKKTDQPSNVVVLMIDCGPFSLEKKAALDVLTTGLKEPFFSELRSKQQTGYVVHNWSQEVEKHLYSFFLTQSSTHDTRDLIARFELFFETALANLRDDVLPETRFLTIRDSLITSLEHPAENIKTMAELLFDIAFDYDRDFAFLEQQKGALKDLTYASFLEHTKEFIGKENSKRVAICLNGKLAAKDTLTYKRIPSLEKVRETMTYKEKNTNE